MRYTRLVWLLMVAGLGCLGQSGPSPAKPHEKPKYEVITMPLSPLGTPLTQEQISTIDLRLSKARPQISTEIEALLPKGWRLFPVCYDTCSTTNRSGTGRPGLYTRTTSVCRLNQTTDIVVEEDDNTTNCVDVVRGWRIRHLSEKGKP
jgi:hypothetical protein